MSDYNGVPIPPPVGTIVRSHMNIENSVGESYPRKTLWKITKIIVFQPQDSKGYWSLEVENTESKERMKSFDDYFKVGLNQLNEMDIVERACLFDG